MEILIQIPPWLVDGFEEINRYATICHELILTFLTNLLDFLRVQQNAWWFFFSLVVFWPLWVYFAIAVTTASTWFFWLLASVVIGIVQVGYATYQFSMIAFDVLGLTLLKTYAVVVRSRIVQFLFFFNKRLRNSQQRSSRRRAWKKMCEQAKEYTDFLRLYILEPTNNSSSGNGNDNDENQVDAALPKRSKKSPRRSWSAGTLSPLNEDSETMLPIPTRRRRSFGMSRNKSFNEGDFHKYFMEEEEDPVIVQDLGAKTTKLLSSTISRLSEARYLSRDGEQSNLNYLLSGVVKRNHLTLEDNLVMNCRSVAESGQYGFAQPTRKLIATYYSEVSEGLDCMAESPVAENADPLIELGDRMTLVRKMKQNMGRTALMLSGGGAQAMYHLGTIRALVDSGVYGDIKVISGTSGGSITAAMCALKTSKELFDHVCVPTVSTDFMHTGEMKKKNIRWFPPVMEMGAYWLKHKLLVDSALFRRTCEFYYQDTTFEEAFEKTGKHVCITVSASRASGDTAQRLLLNHISTPHVTLASAVAASCALPGVMAPAKLQSKNSSGELDPFEVDGVEWIDGSVQADLPFQRISTLFNVSNYIVCQTNFHVVPFLNKDYHPNTRSGYWRLFQTVEWDIRNRALKLSKLGLFPKIFGQDISKVFKQKYHGNLTLVPRFTAMQTFGLKALVNPTVRDMEGYLKYGQIAAWPYISAIREMVRLERALDECLSRLEERCRGLHPDVDWSSHDDLDSIASGSMNNVHTPNGSTRGVRFVNHEREVERLRMRLIRAEQENAALKQKLKAFESSSSSSPPTSLLDNKQSKDSSSSKKSQNTFTNNEEKKDEKEAGGLQVSEGELLNLVQKLNFDAI